MVPISRGIRVKNRKPARRVLALATLAAALATTLSIGACTSAGSSRGGAATATATAKAKPPTPRTDEDRIAAALRTAGFRYVEIVTSNGAVQYGAIVLVAPCADELELPVVGYGSNGEHTGLLAGSVGKHEKAAGSSLLVVGSDLILKRPPTTPAEKAQVKQHGLCNQVHKP